METRALEKQDWQKMLDHLSKIGKDRNITIEVAGEGIGAQSEAEDVALVGMSYGPKDNIVYIIAEDIEHNISNPARIELAQNGGDISAVAVLDESGTRHLLRFDPPLHMPDLA
jgi:hypothetical protein